jgi:hypothetical protein
MGSIVFDERGRILTKTGEDLKTCSCLRHEKQLLPADFKLYLEENGFSVPNYRLPIKKYGLLGYNTV